MPGVTEQAWIADEKVTKDSEEMLAARKRKAAAAAAAGAGKKGWGRRRRRLRGGGCEDAEVDVRVAGDDGFHEGVEVTCRRLITRTSRRCHSS